MWNCFPKTKIKINESKGPGMQPTSRELAWIARVSGFNFQDWKTNHWKIINLLKVHSHPFLDSTQNSLKCSGMVHKDFEPFKHKSPSWFYWPKDLSAILSSQASYPRVGLSPIKLSLFQTCGIVTDPKKRGRLQWANITWQWFTSLTKNARAKNNNHRGNSTSLKKKKT